MMKRFLLVLIVTLLLLGCQRGGAPAEDGDLPAVDEFDWPPTPIVSPEEEGFDMPAGGGEVILTPGVPSAVFPTVEALDGRFSNLRFATSGNGDPQGTFPVGTEEVYAIWDYDGMQPGDQVQRVWYHNDQQYIDRTEEWDFLKYGYSGTVRDVYHYNYQDGGVYPGNWRVEIYLNGVQQASGTFTVGAP